MITTTEVAKRTGLSVKTLSRWAKRGIIPKPATGTHPKGRGKIGYWPDHVLDRCLRLVQLRKEGHDIETAAVMLQVESVSERLEALDKPKFADVLDRKYVRAKDGREVALSDVLLALIASDLRDSVLDRDRHGTLLAQLRQDNQLRRAMHLIQGGYNPYLTFDGGNVRIEPDFILCYGSSGPNPTPLFQFPLLPPIRKLFATLGGEELVREPRIMPAPKVWVNEGGVMVEYMIHLAGPLGFELLRQTAQTIGTTKGEEEDEDEDKSP